MADSPIIVIKVDNMTCVQRADCNSQQKSMNSGPQNTAVNNYPVTAEQAVRELQRNVYFADIQKTVDEENFVSPDELMESPQQMYLSLVKSRQRFKTITKTVYSSNMYGNKVINGSNHMSPAVKNKFTSIRFADFIVSEASIIYVENGYTFDKRIYLKCVSIYGHFDVVIPLDDFNRYRIKKYIDLRAKFQVFTNNFKDSEINRLMFNYIKNKLSQSGNEYLLLYKPGFKREENGNWRFVPYDKSAFLMSETISKSHFDIKNFEVEEAGRILNKYCYLIKKKKIEQVALLRLSALLLASLGYKLSKAIVIYGCNSNERKQAVNTWLKVYNRDGNSGSQIYKLSALKQSQRIALCCLTTIPLL